MTVKFSTENIFFTADTHFFHRAMVPLRGFSAVDEMNAVLLTRWNAVVPPGGLVFHLGDVSFGKTDETVGLLGQLNGKIILVKGNHDSGMKAAVRSRFLSVHDYLEAAFVLPGGTAQRIVLLHYALRVWNRHHYGAWHLHGHSHGHLIPVGRALDVGVDAVGLAPVPYEKVAAWMAGRDTHVIDQHLPPE